MSYYTRRNGLLKNPEPRSDVTLNDYEALFDVCKNYFDNIAYQWTKYSSRFPDKCVGIDTESFKKELNFLIPGLGRNLAGEIVDPSKVEVMDIDCTFSIFDLIEFMFEYIHDFAYISLGFERVVEFKNTNNCRSDFKNKINRRFEDLGLQYVLTDSGQIERLTENGQIIDSLYCVVEKVSEDGTSELIKEAIDLFKDPSPDSGQASLEKIWAAYERVKSMYDSDKKRSIGKILDTISGGDLQIRKFLEEDMQKLTDLGNNCEIRHHEVGKIKIKDRRHADYLFNKCATFIELIIDYMEV